MWSLTSFAGRRPSKRRKRPALLVVVDQRRRLLVVDLQAPADRLLLVVVALDQPRAVLVADALVLGGVELEVVDVAAFRRTRGARRDGARPRRRRPRSAAPRVRRRSSVPSASPSASACCSLRGKPSSRNPSRASSLADAREDHADDHLVGDQLAGVHVALRLPAELGALGHLGAQHVAGGDVRRGRSPRAGARPGCPCRPRAGRAG